jgi:negative regulator of flagellin synthesis FlgM
MVNRKKPSSGRPKPDNYHKSGKAKKARKPRATKDAVLSGNKKLIERVHQIISEAPDIRPEKVGPLQEAVEQGTYCIDVRKLANILLTKMFQDP